MSKIVMNRSNIERLLVEKVKELLSVDIEFNTLLRDIDTQGSSSIYLQSTTGEYVALCRQDNSSRTLYIRVFKLSEQWAKELDSKEKDMFERVLSYNEHGVVRDPVELEQCYQAKFIVESWTRDYAERNNLVIKKLVGANGTPTIVSVFVEKLEKLFIVNMGLEDGTQAVVTLQIEEKNALLSAYAEVGQWQMEGRLM